MLVQRAAADDVQRLHAAADRQQREVALGGGGEQGELVLVGDAIDVGAERGVRQLSVRRRVEVGPAAEDQAVEPVEQRSGVVDVAVGGHDDGDPAGLLDRLRVGQPQ